MASGLERVAPRPVLRLADGRAAVLAGVVVPGVVEQEAGAAIRAWLEARHEPGVLAAPADRHGRVAVVPRREGEMLQAALVEAGLALSAPEAGVERALLEGLLGQEARARGRGLGLWAGGESGPFPADAVPAAAEGGFVLVEGRIARTARASMYWYVNFGRSLRTDFTVRVPLAAGDAFAAAGLDLAVLAGRRVRARGWLFEENGPMIEITHPLSLELLP